MNRPVRWAVLAAVVGLTAATAGGTRGAVIVDFSYSGRGGPGDAGLIATGTGRFSFADGLTTVGLADLTAFAFTLDENTPNTATFGLPDLTSFAAEVGPGPTLTSLALATDAVQGTNPQTWPREFTVSSLDPDGAATRVVILGVSLEQTTGTVTITPAATAPGPSAAALAAVGTLVAAAGRAGRRTARTTVLGR